MTTEKFTEIKNSYISHIKQYLCEMGNIFPHLSVFGKHLDNPDQDAIVHIPIPDEFMQSDERKEQFVVDVIPMIAEKIRERFIPYGVGWTSEAWVRTASKEKGVPENWKDLPIEKEVLMVTLEFAGNNEAMIYEIKRNGHQVTEEGELVDKVELIEMHMGQPEGFSGRFTNLLQKFKVHS